MRGEFFLSLAAAAALTVAVPEPALAQTPDEYADRWTEARRGDRNWRERATEQLTTPLADRIFGPIAQGTMKEIVNTVTRRVEAMRNVSQNRRHGPCQSAALEQAFGQALDTGRQEVLAGAGGTFLSVFQSAAGGGGWQQFLGKKLTEQLGETLRDKALDEFKNQMRERMRQGSPEHYEDDNNAGGCRTEFRVVWDKAQERYMFLMAGDCQCKLVSCGPHFPGRKVQLARWTLEGWGTVIPEITQSANGEKRVRYRIGAPRDVSLTADCCRGQGERRYGTLPRNGPGNEWVGFVRRPQTGTPPRRPQTGGTRPSTGGTETGPQQGTTPPPTPTRPPRRQIDIPEVPDRPMTRQELEQLGERLHRAQQQARSLHREAVTYLTELRKRPGASAADIRDAEAAAEEAARAARRARAALDKVMQKFTELDQQEQQRQQQQQSSVSLDPASARMLAVHNQERSAVGLPPLRWDPALQAAATGWAVQLARTGRLAHAPREGRGITRENLSQGMIGWTPEQMMASWVREKSDFIPGVYPNVTRTGRWQDVSHYTQMIWPETTHIGCGMATGSGYQWLVCRYSPGGNKEGKPVGLSPPPI